MENTNNNNALYILSVDYESAAPLFWQTEGAAIYEAGAALARALDCPVETDAERVQRYALPLDLGRAVETLLESCRDWTPAPYCDHAPHPILIEARAASELSDVFPQEPSEDAEPQTETEPSEDAEQDAPSEEQEPDDDYRRTFNKVFGALVFDYCVENYEHTDEQENAIEAYTLDAQKIESCAARKSVVYMVESDDSFAPEDYLENAERVDALDDDAQEFYLDAIDNGGLDPFGAIDAAEDYATLDNGEQALCRTLIEDGHESPDDAVEHARSDYWFLVNVRYSRYCNDTAIGLAYIENMGGVESLDKSDLEAYFDYEKYGADLREKESLIETPDGDVWIEH